MSCRVPYEIANGRRAARRTPVDFPCQTCGKTFQMMPSYVRAYRKKWGKDPMYCSRKCAGAGLQRRAIMEHTFICVHCGTVTTKRRKPGGRIYTQQKYCSNECKSKAQMKQGLDRFNRGELGRHIKRNGYVWISVPALASTTGKKTEMLEHRYIMQKKLGRALYPEETVHHIDGNRQHNVEENLELFSSRHGPGQRVRDKVEFAIEILTLYPDFAAERGYKLAQV